MSSRSLGTADMDFCERLGRWSAEHRGGGVSDSLAFELTGVRDGEERNRALIDAIGLLYLELRAATAER